MVPRTTARYDVIVTLFAKWPVNLAFPESRRQRRTAHGGYQVTITPGSGPDLAAARTTSSPGKVMLMTTLMPWSGRR